VLAGNCERKCGCCSEGMQDRLGGTDRLGGLLGRISRETVTATQRASREQHSTKGLTPTWGTVKPMQSASKDPTWMAGSARPIGAGS
jgi:hypothetical protein